MFQKNSSVAPEGDQTLHNYKGVLIKKLPAKTCRYTFISLVIYRIYCFK